MGANPFAAPLPSGEDDWAAQIAGEERKEPTPREIILYDMIYRFLITPPFPAPAPPTGERCLPVSRPAHRGGMMMSWISLLFSSLFFLFLGRLFSPLLLLGPLHFPRGPLFFFVSRTKTNHCHVTVNVF